MHVVLAVTSVMFLAIWAQVDTQRTRAGSWQSVSFFALMR
jgi:hypothetical protein